jgi:hypothetical protein
MLQAICWFLFLCKPRVDSFVLEIGIASIVHSITLLPDSIVSNVMQRIQIQDLKQAKVHLRNLSPMAIGCAPILHVISTTMLLVCIVKSVLDPSPC